MEQHKVIHLVEGEWQQIQSRFAGFESCVRYYAESYLARAKCTNRKQQPIPRIIYKNNVY